MIEWDVRVDGGYQVFVLAADELTAKRLGLERLVKRGHSVDADARLEAVTDAKGVVHRAQVRARKRYG